MNEAIRKNVELVKDQILKEFGVSLNYSYESIEFLDSYIRKMVMRGAFAGDPAGIHKVAGVIGSFYGECIVQMFGGKWIESDKGPIVQISEALKSYPFHTVATCMSGEEGKSLMSVARSTEAFLKEAKRRAGSA